jgi:hypothetical protein
MAFLASLTDPTLTATTTTKGSLNFTLAPNPARAAATVQLAPVPGATHATLVLTDALGRVVRSHTPALSAAGLRYELLLNGLAQGVYALRVEAGISSTVRRLVVE